MSLLGFWNGSRVTHRLPYVGFETIGCSGLVLDISTKDGVS